MRWTMIALALALVAALSFSVPAYAHWRGGWYGGYSAGYYSPYFYSSGWGYPAGTYYSWGSQLLILRVPQVQEVPPVGLSDLLPMVEAHSGTFPILNRGEPPSRGAFTPISLFFPGADCPE